jgi:hypothetical protein
MGLRSAGKTVTFDTPGKTLALTYPDHIDLIPHCENIYIQLITLLELSRALDTEFSQVAQRGVIISFEMAELSTRQLLLFYFAKSELDRKVLVSLRTANLGYITWPSFD